MGNKENRPNNSICGWVIKFNTVFRNLFSSLLWHCSIVKTRRNLINNFKSNKKQNHKTSGGVGESGYKINQVPEC